MRKNNGVLPIGLRRDKGEGIKRSNHPIREEEVMRVKRRVSPGKGGNKKLKAAHIWGVNVKKCGQCRTKW